MSLSAIPLLLIVMMTFVGRFLKYLNEIYLDMIANHLLIAVRRKTILWRQTIFKNVRRLDAGALTYIQASF